MTLLALLACAPPEPPRGPGGTTTSAPPTSGSIPTLSYGGQSGEDYAYYPCPPVGVVGPGVVVQTADGPISGADLREDAGGAFDAPLRWVRTPDTEVHASFDWSGEIRELAGYYCDPGLEIDGTYAIRTDDGLLDEQGSAVLVATAPAGDVEIAWAEGEIEGSWPFPADDEIVSTLTWNGEVGVDGMRGPLIETDETTAVVGWIGSR